MAPPLQRKHRRAGLCKRVVGKITHVDLEQLTRQLPDESLFFFTIFFHMYFGFLSVRALLGAKTLLSRAPIPALTVSGAAGAKAISCTGACLANANT